MVKSWYLIDLDQFPYHLLKGLPGCNWFSVRRYPVPKTRTYEGSDVSLNFLNDTGTEGIYKWDEKGVEDTDNRLRTK